MTDEPPLNLEHGFTVCAYFPPGSDPAWVSAFLGRVADDAYSMPSDTLDAFVVGSIGDVLGIDGDEEPDRYAAMVDAPLRPETVAAINERLKSGTAPVRKVRARVRDMGREPAVLAIPEDQLEPLLALADDGVAAPATQASVPTARELGESFTFAMDALMPRAEPVFCHHEHRTVRWRTSGGVTTCTATCSACPARAQSTEGEPVLAPFLLNASRCTEACTERHTVRPGCLLAPDFSKPINRSEP